MLCSRRRTYVCTFFDYTYAGIGKEVGKEWNSRFITFVPFLCGLTVELAAALTTLCELESSQELLFQQSKQDLDPNRYINNFFNFTVDLFHSY